MRTLLPPLRSKRGGGLGWGWQFAELLLPPSRKITATANAPTLALPRKRERERSGRSRFQAAQTKESRLPENPKQPETKHQP